MAFPPSPEDDVELELDVAVPVEPVEPVLACDDELALPECATPTAAGSDEAEPLPPVLPLAPEPASDFPLPAPEPPVDDEAPPELESLPAVSIPVVAADGADWAGLGATIWDVVDEEGVCAGLLSAAAKARARTKPGVNIYNPSGLGMRHKQNELLRP